MAELSDVLYEEITDLLDQGDEAAEKEAYEEGLNCYLKALELVPEPKTDWEISLHVYTALADLYFNIEDYECAIQSYNQALQCPDGTGYGYIWLGLGQTFYEMEEEDRAKDAFMRAYMLEGEEIFEEEDEHYFALIKDMI